MSRIDRLVPWLVGAFVLVALLGAIYLAAQNLERSGANDAPARLASQLLSAAPSDPARVDLATSLAPFYVIYTAEGSPSAGDGYLNGALAQVPAGVIASAAANGSNTVTWQPRDGLRFATVEIHDGSRVILAGQSLAPSEARINNLGKLLLAGGAGCLALLAVGGALHLRAGRRLG